MHKGRIGSEAQNLVQGVERRQFVCPGSSILFLGIFGPSFRCSIVQPSESMIVSINTKSEPLRRALVYQSAPIGSDYFFYVAS